MNEEEITVELEGRTVKIGMKGEGIVIDRDLIKKMVLKPDTENGGFKILEWEET